MKKKVVLAFSGGLDTSYCIKYLSKEKGLEVDAVHVNVGGATNEELEVIEDRAMILGANNFKIIDRVESYYCDYIKYLIFGDVLRNGTYPLSVSAERFVQARAIAEYANEVKASCIAHGSTGAGNDQVRFDVVFGILCPEMEIITPIRDMNLSREAEIKYLKENGVFIEWTKAKYSINKGLWGTSIGGVETLTSHLSLPNEAFPSQLINSVPVKIKLEFVKGELNAIDGKSKPPVQLIEELNKIGGEFAIGRDIHIGDTIVGIKGRVAFEAPAALILIKAHQTLEKHVLTKWQLYWKEQLSNWYGMFLHEAQFLDPVMRNIESFLDDTQKKVTGEVTLILSPYSFSIQGIQSNFDLMSPEFGSYGEENKGFSGDDVRGFTKVFSNANRISNMVEKTIL